MRRDTRKQPWQTFPFWFLILSGMALTTAWKLDLLRPQPPNVATKPEPADAELGPDWANTALETETPTGVAEQGEPMVESSAKSDPDDWGTDLTSTEDQGDPAIGEHSTEATAKTDSPSNDKPFSRTDARLVSAQREQGPSKAFTPSKTLPEGSESVQNRSAKSPFGPAKVEFQGTRRPNSNHQPAENAAWTDGSDTAKAPSDNIKQTASIDSGYALDAATQNPSKPRTEKSPSSKNPDAGQGVPVDFSTIDQLILDGEDVEANFQLSNLYWKRPEIRDQLMKRLSVVAYRIYFAPQPHYMDGHVIQAGDMLENIAKDYDVSWEYLVKLNRTDAKKIRPGQKLKVIRGPFEAVIDLSDREMTIHSHGHYVARFEVGIGKDSSSPIGTLKVQDKQRDPIYYGPDGVIDQDDPQNPLGEYWLDLGDSYGIHGTIDEKSIGEAESQGCIRMKNRDIADVFDLLTVGSEVIIRR